jgi:hypothetical protein
MKSPAFILMCVLLLSTFVACNHETPTAVAGRDVSGSWVGTLDNMKLTLALKQGEFEGGVTLSGSANLSNDSMTVQYSIGSGNHNRIDKITFGLYPIPYTTKESILLFGSMSDAFLEGTFRSYDAQGVMISSGTWSVKKQA